MSTSFYAISMELTSENSNSLTKKIDELNQLFQQESSLRSIIEKELDGDDSFFKAKFPNQSQTSQHYRDAFGSIGRYTRIVCYENYTQKISQEKTITNVIKEYNTDYDAIKKGYECDGTIYPDENIVLQKQLPIIISALESGITIPENNYPQYCTTYPKMLWYCVWNRDHNTLKRLLSFKPKQLIATQDIWLLALRLQNNNTIDLLLTHFTPEENQYGLNWISDTKYSKCQPHLMQKFTEYGADPNTAMHYLRSQIQYITSQDLFIRQRKRMDL
jgi:hypothetical protein